MKYPVFSEKYFNTKHAMGKFSRQQSDNIFLRKEDFILICQILFSEKDKIFFLKMSSAEFFTHHAKR